ncbi:unnamed protein product [Ceutorhynchus assimilis]|uniref:DUF4485 domain-containing protein n=1 Tax=Ceutorhynchus assimilis TaxID=467358 RepID=A0A9N9MIV1_9CUCU|nr:unnamed protein product [Ceutorhynchus assimilis]
MEINETSIMEGGPNPCIALDDQFRYNYQLVERLQESLSPNEQNKIQTWCEKLLTMDQNVNQMELRCEYMWFIFIMLQAGGVRDPFMQLPPIELPPLTQFLPWQVYDEVLLSMEPRMNLEAKGENQT